MVLVGVIAAILLALGLLPPYFEIWKRRGRVIGISEQPILLSLCLGSRIDRLCLLEYGLAGGIIFPDGSWYV